MIAIINKHYSAILKNIPVEFNIGESRKRSHGQRMMTKYDYRICNETLFNNLVNEVVSPDTEKTLVDFCRMLLMLIGDKPVVRELMKGY